MKKALTISILFIILWLPWYIKGKLISSGGVYFSQFLLKNPYQPNQGYIDFTSFVERLDLNLATYFFTEIPNLILPYHFRTSMIQGQSLPLILGVLLSVIFVAGLVLAFRNGQYILSVYTVFYIGIIMIWFEGWSGARFVIPIIPMLVYFSGYFLYQMKEKL